ncbi:unnamed protein product [Euphydryas editha]|uniref:Inositol-3-phosphate synthase n=1 Tax=Euphydryas editha TaxID=104508 RepID=A0AAU9U4P0_EUPED|nr:unnamed protein product [Euphydryas editha]
MNTIQDNNIVELFNCIDYSNYKSITPNNPHNLTFVHVNIRSLVKNFSKIEQILSASNSSIDFIVITEVNVPENIKSLYNIPGYTLYSQLRQSRRGGGIIVYIKNKYKFKQHKTTTLHFECLLGTINSTSSSVVLCAVYRPPSNNKHHFIKEIEKVLKRFEREDVVFLGDVNINLKINNPVKKSYLDMMSGYGLSCGITDYTRIEILNGLVLNADKTKVIHVRSSHKYQNDDESINVIAHSHECMHNLNKQCTNGCLKIKQVNEHTYLGLVIDSRFNWANHINRVCNKVRTIMAKFYIIKSKIPCNTLLIMFCEVTKGVHDTSENLERALRQNNNEISPSTIFAMAAIDEGCCYVNGSPQNTLVDGLIERAEKMGVFVAGDDFKSGQTKLKSVLVDFLVSAGLKPVSIVSYNHLGNNDGKNLSAPRQFRSKEITKSNVVDDMVASNSLLYAPNEKPDHVVVIKYVPYVGDSKRAMDEYTSEILLHGTNTIVVHNTCEDSLLAVPLILDLVLLTDLFCRVSFRKDESSEWAPMHPVLSTLGYLLKAPLVPPGAPVVNALTAQRAALVDLMRACLALPPAHQLRLEHKVPFLMSDLRSGTMFKSVPPSKKQKITHENGDK